MNNAQTTVSIDTPARLHMGFLDLNGGMERRFGGLGVAVDGISTHLSATVSDSVQASGPGSERAERLARTTLEALGLREGVDIQLHSIIPEHAGLGSGTQMALAISTAIAKLYRVDCGTAELAALTERGARSGIGIGTFEQGGFVVDGGRGPKTDVPPVLMQQAFPEAWRFILIFDDDTTGLNGSAEKSAFREMPEMTPACSGHLCRLLMMRVLPALVEQDFEAFSPGITEIQQRIGDYFARYQGGRFSSQRVGDVLEWLDGEGVTGRGQSSWGPTGFALFNNEMEASRMLKALEQEWAGHESLSFRVCRAHNRGARIMMQEGTSQRLGNHH